MLGSRCHWHAAKNTSVHSDCCFFPDVPSKLHENSLSASVDMAAVPDAMPTARFGLIDFDAIDTSGRPQLDDEEELAGDYPGVKLSLGEEAELGQGHLYISSKRIIWLSTTQPVKGCFATFPSITMHAISQEPVPCIYAQLETACSASSEDDESDDMYPEIRLIPADSDKLQEIFETLCQCAALNPDSNDDSEEGDFFYNEEEVLNGVGAADRAALLDRYDAMLGDSEQPELEELTGEDPDRFADPDDEDGSPHDVVHPST